MSDLERMTRPGHDRDVARAILSQSLHQPSRIDDIQVRHLLAIGYRAGSATAEARVRQQMIDALRDGQAYMEWVRVGQRDGTQPHRGSWGTSDVMYAADYLDSIAKEGADDS